MVEVVVVGVEVVVMVGVGVVAADVRVASLGTSRWPRASTSRGSTSAASQPTLSVLSSSAWLGEK